MKTYTYNFDNNNTFRSNKYITNASKALDALILSNIKKMNPYLKKDIDPTLNAMLEEANTDSIIKIDLLKDTYEDKYNKAIKFLSNYSPKNNNTIYIKDIPITFFEDEIQIGYELIPLYKLKSSCYYNNFNAGIKNIIINLFITINK